jgi:hypothetical protein
MNQHLQSGNRNDSSSITIFGRTSRNEMVDLPVWEKMVTRGVGLETNNGLP